MSARHQAARDRSADVGTKAPPSPADQALRSVTAVDSPAPVAIDEGIRVLLARPVGGWTIDLVVTDAESTIGVFCGVHPGGVDAHVERHLALRRAGWRLLDVFEDAWTSDPDRAAAHIVETLRRTAH